eukprot:2133755-Prymnesium_polylepis.1
MLCSQVGSHLCTRLLGLTIRLLHPRQQARGQKLLNLRRPWRPAIGSGAALAHKVDTRKPL